ncbi:MAG: FAD-dependent thymidylate synthase, partial [Acidimicrobiales bacterium]
VPRQAGDSDFVWRQATRAKALDATRGALPAASLSNLGIYGSGQAFENLLLRMRSHPLPEARHYADLMLVELRKVIPSFLKRVDMPDRGGKWTDYLAGTAADTAELAEDFLADAIADEVEEVSLVDFDPDGEIKVVAAALYPHTHLPESQVLARVEKMSTERRLEILRAYVGERENRRHRPGRAFERTDYRFDVLSDYGAFRDLQRHRLLTIEWQPLTPYHGYSRPDLLDAAGVADDFDEVMHRSSSLYELLAADHPQQASYAVSMAYRIRYVMQFNVREAMHMLELRSSPQGHPSYRRVALEMHRQIAEVAGHRALAAAMTHMTTEAPELERLAAERAAERKRTTARKG